MALLEWNDKMSVGVPALDEDHRKLLDLLNELHGVVRNQAPPDTVERVLRDLIAYADYHFEAEERLMRMARYPDFDAHKESHDSLRAQVSDLQAKFKTDNAALRLKTFDFLSTWLMRHILGEDMKYKEALNARQRPRTADSTKDPAKEG